MMEVPQCLPIHSVMWRHAERHHGDPDHHLAVLPQLVPGADLLPLDPRRPAPGVGQAVRPDLDPAAGPELLQQLPGDEGLAGGERRTGSGLSIWETLDFIQIKSMQ